jgi:ArsR family transcriptional regulator
MNVEMNARRLDSAIDMPTAFKALGDPTRLRIFEFLRDCCCPVAVEDSGDVRPVEGVTVGEICCRITGVDKVSSAISFHLKELRLAGLINVERRGKNLICSVNRDAVRRLSAYFDDGLAAASTACCE